MRDALIAIEDTQRYSTWTLSVRTLNCEFYVARVKEALELNNNSAAETMAI